MRKKVGAKVNGKWWTFGSIKVNRYNNLSLSMKNTPELKRLVNDGGEWLNFSLFDDEEKPTSHQQAKQDGYQPRKDLDDEVPF